MSDKKWCAMCGKWGDHQSGTCPELHPSADGPSEIAAPSGALGVARGCLEVSSAEVLDVASYLDERAADWRNCQLRHEKAGEAMESVEYFKARKVLIHCSEILRRHAAALKKRQPQDNGKAQP